MEARWLPATQSGLHYLAHTGIIKESDQRADYFSTAELQDSFLFVLSLCRPLFLFVVFDSFFLVAFLSLRLSSIRYSSNVDHMEAGEHLSLYTAVNAELPTQDAAVCSIN